MPPIPARSVPKLATIAAKAAGAIQLTARPVVT